MAELRNVTQRALREKQEALRYAEADFARELLVVLDDLERTQESAKSASDVQSVVEGVRIVYEHFLKVLRGREIEPIEAAGKPFDPNCHEAMMQQPSDKQPAGHGSARRFTRLPHARTRHPAVEGDRLQRTGRRARKTRSRDSKPRVREHETMPTYEYACDNCGHEFEEFQSITAKPLKKCPSCGKSKLQRLIGTGAGVIFKGSGFYETDYRSESYKKAAEAEKKAASGSSTADDAKKAGDSTSTDGKKQGNQFHGSVRSQTDEIHPGEAHQTQSRLTRRAQATGQCVAQANRL